MNLAQKKLFLLDLDGTIYLEESLLPGAAEFLAWVRETGGAYRFLTNNSSRGVDAGLEKMHRLGIPAQPEEFLTAVEATVHTCGPAVPRRMSTMRWGQSPSAARSPRRASPCGRSRRRT